jgi:ABC-2 type transport system permease protein
MWHNINPIVIREVRGRMRSPRAFWLLAGFLSAVASTMLLVYTASDLSSSNRATASSETGNTVFLTLIGTAMLVLLVLTTILAASSIAGERERQTFDLLLTSQLSAGAIVIGKICATMAYGGLLLSAMTHVCRPVGAYGGGHLLWCLLVEPSKLTTHGNRSVAFMCVWRVVWHTHSGIHGTHHLAVTLH